MLGKVAVNPLPRFIPAVFVAGLNYSTHAAEVNLPIPKYPIFAMKSPSAVLYPTNAGLCGSGPTTVAVGDEIVVPKSLQDPLDADYEGELAIIIGKRCRDVPAEDGAVEDVVGGYTVALDVTSRRWQGKKGGNQWCYAKSFDTFCPLGPHMVNMPIRDVSSLELRTVLNGEVVQRDSTANLIFGVKELVSFLSRDATLEAGSVILTGTPSGVGFTRSPPRYLQRGDVLAVSVEHIGVRECAVAFAR